jgi:anaerobic dimethyl sulfoxide reductase subunit B
VTRSAFHFDAAACSGCKACQIACRDRNALPAGVLWRRVYEVAGGGWKRHGEAWVNDVVAYNVSIACNHCERAICVEVCPTGAMTARADGVVLIDAARCTGCRYCEWACPYAAPQYDAAAGRMTKCTACSDDVAAGMLPACVSACPLRVLDFGDAAELAARHGGTADLHPLPDARLTLPSLLVTPHPSAPRVTPHPSAPRVTPHSSAPRVTPHSSAPGVTPHSSAPHAVPPRVTTGGNGADTAAGLPRVMNREEVIGSAAARTMREPSLVAFTLLAQAAVGLFWAVFGVRLSAGADANPLLAAPFLAVGPLLLAAVLASLLHLGTPRNAWRALANVRQSWLSREIMATLLFGGGWLVLLSLHAAGWTSAVIEAVAATATALAGAGLVYSMARVYRLRTVPAWNSPLTSASFLLAAGTLGSLSCALLLAITAPPAAAAHASLAADAASGQLARSVVDSIRLLLLGAAACSALDLLLSPAWRAHRRAADSATEPGLRHRAMDVSSPNTATALHAAGLALIAVALLASTPDAAAALPQWLSTAAIGLALGTVLLAASFARSLFYSSRGRLGL